MLSKNAKVTMMLITGAVVSGTVGTMYGYSYVKETIDEYWKTKGADMESLSEMGLAEDAYTYGFVGQYAGFIPGAIFDNFGPVVTIFYGAAMIFMGYIGLGFGIAKGASWAVAFGITMAGLGSKGLGMGTMMGSQNLIDAKYVSSLSGLYLGLDSFSAIFALLLYQAAFQPDFETPNYDKDEKGNYVLLDTESASQAKFTNTKGNMVELNDLYYKQKQGEALTAYNDWVGDANGIIEANKDTGMSFAEPAKPHTHIDLIPDYFVTLAITIGIIGVTGAFIYMYGLKKSDEEKKSEEEQPLTGENIDIDAGVDLVSGDADDTAKVKAAEEARATKEKPAVPEKQTFWMGVI